MSDYTPTTEDVREDYAIGRNEVIGAGWYSQHRAEFDSWLAAHDAAIAHAAWSEGHTQALVNVAWPDERKSNPYTTNESEQA